MKKVFYSLLLALTTSSLQSQSASVDDTISTLLDIPESIDITDSFIDKRDAYTHCVQQVMSRLEPALSKRLRLDAECESASAALIAEFPTHSQGFVRENMQRRLNVVLTALERSEATVEEVISDSTDIVDMIAPDIDARLPGAVEGEEGYADEGLGENATIDVMDIPLPGAEDI